MGFEGEWEEWGTRTLAVSSAMSFLCCAVALVISSLTVWFSLSSSDVRFLRSYGWQRHIMRRHR